MVNFLFVVDNSYSTDLNVFFKLCFQRFLKLYILFQIVLVSETLLTGKEVKGRLKVDTDYFTQTSCESLSSKEFF